MNRPIIVIGKNPELSLYIENTDSGFDIMFLGEVLSSYNNNTKLFTDYNIDEFYMEHLDWLLDEEIYDNSLIEEADINNNVIIIVDEAGYQKNIYDINADISDIEGIKKLVAAMKLITSVSMI